MTCLTSFSFDRKFFPANVTLEYVLVTTVPEHTEFTSW